MNFVKQYSCTLCGKTYNKTSKLMTCPDCGEKGILEIEYDYQAMKQVVTKEYFQSNNDYTILRYQPLMSIKKPEVKPLEVGWTPLYEAKRLKEYLGLNHLFIKDDGVNPTSSLKDRASLVGCLKAIEDGYDTVCCSSTGNAASSLAGNAARLGLECVIFVPKRAPIGKLTQMMAYGAKVLPIDGDYKQTFNVSKAIIEKHNFYNRNAAINPHLVEGKKTVSLEISEQMGFEKIDKVFVSVGDGCSIYGVYKGFNDLYNLGIITDIPQIFGIQSTGCSPFVDAWENDRDLEETNEDTIADSIAVGIPRNPIKGMKAVKASDGMYLRVTDDDIIAAMKLLGKTEGIFAEPAAAASLAGLIKATNNKLVKKDDKVVVIVTGNGLKDPKALTNQMDALQQYDPTDLERINNILKRKGE